MLVGVGWWAGPGPPEAASLAYEAGGRQPEVDRVKTFDDAVRLMARAAAGVAAGSDAWRGGRRLVRLVPFLLFISNILLFFGGLYGELYERPYIISYFPPTGPAGLPGPRLDHRLPLRGHTAPAGVGAGVRALLRRPAALARGVGWREQRRGAEHDPDGGEDGRLSGGRPASMALTAPPVSECVR